MARIINTEINIILIIFILLFEIKRKKQRKIDFLSLFNFFYLLYYPLSAILVLNRFHEITWISVQRYYAYNYILSWNITIAVVIFYFIVILGFYFPPAYKWPTYMRPLRNLGAQKSIFLISCILVFSSVCYLLYTMHFGGPIGYIAKGYLQRTGEIEMVGEYGFLSRFIYGIPLVMYCSFYWLIAKKFSKYHNIILTSFMISATLCFLYALGYGGRGLIITFLLHFILITIVYHRSYPLILIFVIGLGGAFIIVFGKVFFSSLIGLSQGLDAFYSEMAYIIGNAWQMSNKRTFLGNFTGAFLHRIASLQVAFDYSKFENWRFFVDIPLAFYSLIPTRITKIQPIPTIITLNTYNILGVYDSSIPPGIVAFAVYSFGWIGIVITGFIYGFVGRYIQTVLLKDCETFPFGIPFFVVVAYMWGFSAMGGEPRIFLQRWFIVLIFMAIVIWMSRLPARYRYIVRVTNAGDKDRSHSHYKGL